MYHTLVVVLLVLTLSFLNDSQPVNPHQVEKMRKKYAKQHLKKYGTKEPNSISEALPREVEWKTGNVHEHTPHSLERYNATTYLAHVNYEFLHGQTLLSTKRPVLCVEVATTFGCKPSIISEYVNVTHFLGTRLPKDYHYSSFPLYVFPTLFDWIIISNLEDKRRAASLFPMTKNESLWFGQTVTPKTIYVENSQVPYFTKYMLPKINVPFVMYSGHNDNTVPYNIDKRYNATEIDFELYHSSWNTILANKKVIHWFVENKVVHHPKVSTMPIGMNPKESHPDDTTNFPVGVGLPVKDRPLKMLSVDRIREGEQWDDRNRTHISCSLQPDVCSTGLTMSSHADFVQEVVSYPFVLCVHGGGVDPSPKAWESILIGTIPIIEHSGVDDAYSQLPVAFVQSINDFMTWTNKSEVMKQWLDHLSPHYEEGSVLREQALYKLTTKYWWSKVVSHLGLTIDTYNSKSKAKIIS